MISVSPQPIEYAFRFCPRCASKNPQPGSIPFRCPECEYAQFFGPVAAVGALIVGRPGRLLMVRRAMDPGKGLWGLPGGFVDRWETAEEAVDREVQEETNLRVVERTFLVTFPNEYVYRDVSAPVIDLFYVCRVADGDRLELEQTELEHGAWAEPTAEILSNMAFPSNRRAIETWLAS